MFASKSVFILKLYYLFFFICSRILILSTCMSSMNFPQYINFLYHTFSTMLLFSAGYIIQWLSVRSMFGVVTNLIRKTPYSNSVAPLKCIYKPAYLQLVVFCRSTYVKHGNEVQIQEPFTFIRCISNLASSPSLSIWRRKKELGKEGLIAAKELKRLQSNPLRLDRFIKSQVSRLLKSDLVAVLAEFQRQDQVFLCMKLYDVVRGEIWYRPDMFFYRDMLMMLARNKKVDEAKQVWQDLKKEQVLFDQHTFGDIIRAFLDSGLPSEAMYIYEEMRQSPDPPLSLPFRVILKGLIPYEELREKVKYDFLELFPNMIVYDPAEDLFEDEESDGVTEDD